MMAVRADLGFDANARSASYDHEAEVEIVVFSSRSGRLSKRMLIKDGALIKETWRLDDRGHGTAHPLQWPR